MVSADQFQELLARVRAGDEAAAEQMVRQCEPLIRFEARLHMTDPGLTRLFDSLDICQSVLGSFFVRAAAGQYDLENPNQLVKLLVRMTRNKVASKARKLRVRPADAQRDESVDLALLACPRMGRDPGREATGQDLLLAVQQHMNLEERRIMELRGQCRTWAEIASTLGGTPEGRRKQFARALDLATEYLGLDEAAPPR